jgi:hypothetical protein
MMSYLLLLKLKRRKRTKKSRKAYVFAVSLQEHPELLDYMMPLLRRNVKDYYFSTFPEILYRTARNP